MYASWSPSSTRHVHQVTRMLHITFSGVLGWARCPTGRDTRPHDGGWESSGLVRTGWGRCPSRSRGSLSGPKACAGWGRSKVRRRGRGTGQGRGDPGREVGRGKTGRRRETVWACGRKRTGLV